MLPLKKILVPLDFSRHSTYALRAAAALARDDGAGLILLHVDPPRPDASDAGPGAGEALRDDLERQFDLFSATAGDVPVVRKAALGDPAAAIVGLAGEMGCDLIVMGTHGRTGMARLVAGSVTEQVLRRSDVPVLAVRSPSAAFRPEGAAVRAGAGRRPSAVRTILAPVDVSGRSRHAAQVAAALARAYDADLILLHVQEWDRRLWSESAAGYDAEASSRMHALRRLALLRDELDVVDCERRMVRGRPVEEIIKQADATECDLIVMDARGVGGRDRIPFGSVAEGVVRKANCPVLILREPSVLAAAAPGPGPASGLRDGGAASRPGATVPAAGRDRNIVAHRSTRADHTGVRVHHRDHPKLVGEGATLREAADRLIGLFECERRRPGGERRRSAIAEAASDARRYRTALDRARRPDTPPAAAHPPRRDLR